MHHSFIDNLLNGLLSRCPDGRSEPAKPTHSIPTALYQQCLQTSGVRAAAQSARLPDSLHPLLRILTPLALTSRTPRHCDRLVGADEDEALRSHLRRRPGQVRGHEDVVGHDLVSRSSPSAVHARGRRHAKRLRSPLCNPRSSCGSSRTSPPRATEFCYRTNRRRWPKRLHSHLLEARMRAWTVTKQELVAAKLSSHANAQIGSCPTRHFVPKGIQ